MTGLPPKIWPVIFECKGKRLFSAAKVQVLEYKIGVYSQKIYVLTMPGIDISPITFKELIIGVIPVEIASLANLSTLSHPVAPKLKQSSISR